MSLVVLCPTRGRMAAVRETKASFEATKTRETTHLVFVVNDDERDLYPDVDHIVVPTGEWMGEVLAAGVKVLLEREEPTYIGFIGDDNRFKTPGWDAVVEEVLDAHGGGFAYGDDLAQRGNLPAHVFMSASIVRALGWMCLPGARHLYMDNTWKTLGEGARCIYYLPQIVVQHLHPSFAPVATDESYARSNSTDTYSHDGAVYVKWLQDRSVHDIDTVREALAR